MLYRRDADHPCQFDGDDPEIDCPECGKCDGAPIVEAAILGDLPLVDQLKELDELLEEPLSIDARVEISGGLALALAIHSRGMQRLAAVAGLDTTEPERLAQRFEMMRNWQIAVAEDLKEIAVDCDCDNPRCMAKRARQHLRVLRDFERTSAQQGN